MDALKRAEESKQENARQNGNGEPASEPGLTLEPVNTVPPAPATTSLPELAAHLDAVDADLQAAANAEPKAVPPAKPAGEMRPPTSTPLHLDNGRDMAHAMFAAKTPEPPSRNALWILLGLLALAALGIGGWFWYQLQSISPKMPARPALASAPVQPGPAASAPASLPIAPKPAATVVNNETLASERGKPAAPAETRELEAASPIRLTRSRPTVDANLQRGWQSLQGNSLDAARRDYELALKNDPKNVDALLGLAAIAQRQGRSADSERLIQQAIDADPKDVSALAAQSNQGGAADPQAAESRLKSLLAEQPQSATLNFALGNLYAGQGRWADAQQAYFNAVTADSDNPDYLFNLAVSLDHLRQAKPAAQYYRQALIAAERRPPAFERERLRQRLNQLVTQP